ncbi:hypothetical protein AAULR_03554 [Lacticaseibacillus rhamnosus MTCC 5462]|nr:hypothetical protein AAULR_03554 [Lacticaseibacillus rhamnosus MTCC 5462]
MTKDASFSPGYNEVRKRKEAFYDEKFLWTALGLALVAGGTACYFATMELFKDDADAYKKFESR